MSRCLFFVALLSLVGLSGCGGAAKVEEIQANNIEAIATASDLCAEPGDWPWWRGPRQDGTSADQHPPLEWSDSKNIAWQADVPGRGHASPILVGQRVIVATADEQTQKQLLLSFDRRAGAEQWRTVLHEGKFMRTHGKNSQASATPACDGKRVFTAFLNSEALHVSAVDLEGNKLWQKEAGAFRSEHGYGSSPVLYKSLVIVCGDSAGSSFMAALDREKGDIVWRIPRERTGTHGNYASPVVCQVAGRPQLLLAGHGKVTSYDPATGKLLWFCQGPTEVAGNTVACSDKLVFASAGFPEKEILAIRADGEGDVTSTHVAWRANKGATYVPSPVYHEGHLYVVADNGVASCFDAATGNVLWQERIGGSFSASPVLVGGKLLATDEKGLTHVLEAGPKFKHLGKNQLDDTGMATLASAGDRLYLRGSKRLYCVGK